MRRNRKIRVTKGEKLLYTCALLSLTFILVLKIFCGAGISGLSMNVEVVKADIEKQEKKNESLTMKMSELTSYENIKDVVSDMGLAYNNENIIVIGN